MKYRLIFCILIIASWQTAFAQIQDNSPYSRFGLGDLNHPSLAINNAMGGITAAYSSYYSLNPGNPASYSALGYTAFETGVDAKFSRLTSGEESFNKQTGNMSYFALGFPVFNPLNRMTKKKDYPFDLGASFGLIPHSQVGYNIETQESNSLVGEFDRYSSGKGQRYKLYGGAGISMNGVALGFNANYLFGKVDRNLFVDFNNTTEFWNDVETSGISTSGLVWDLGAQYELVLNKLEDEKEEAKRRNKTRIRVGATYTPSANVNLKGDQSIGRMRISYENYEEVRDNNVFAFDTVSSNIGFTEKMTLPGSFSGGFAIQKDKKWMFSGDFRMTSWEQYNNPIEPEELKNTWRGSFGFEVTPNERAFNSFLKRVRYRAGAYYGLDPRVINEKQLTNYGVTFGFGLPVLLPRGVPSFVNLGFEFGRQGHPELIEDSYFKTSVAFTFNDNSWFFKRKYQ